jgi:HEAT repeat protein
MRRLAAFLTFASLGLAGCDTISSDLDQLSESFSQPTPVEAARWAADPNDRENARRGTVLLANAPWGGAEVYLKLYRLYAAEAPDPLVRAAAIQALGRHGEEADAPLVARNLASPFRQVKLAAAKSLQRLHDPAVADMLWPRLVDDGEDADIRTEIAIALGQYPTPAVFNALVAALSQRELAVNLAAVDSLRAITGQKLGLSEDAWLAYAAGSREPFVKEPLYLYPAFTRDLGFWDRVVFWAPVEFETPDVPIGMKAFGVRRTSEIRGEGAPEGGS